MNWDAIGAIGEIVGALAVVVSLVYLAIQIKAQNNESKAATVQHALDGYASAISRLQDPDLAEIWIAGIEDFDSLSDAQRLRFTMYLTAALRMVENAYYQWQNQRLDDETWRALSAIVKDVKSTYAFSEIFEERRHQFRIEFAEYVDQLEIGDYSYIKKDGVKEIT